MENNVQLTDRNTRTMSLHAITMTCPLVIGVERHHLKMTHVNEMKDEQV